MSSFAESYLSGSFWSSIYGVQILFGILLGLSFIQTFPALVKFYDWFYSSGLEIATKRGYGQTASPAFGQLNSPTLTPSQHRISGYGFMLCLIGLIPGLNLLLMGITGGEKVEFDEGITNQQIYLHVLLIISYGSCSTLYHLFFSQVYCESAVGAHVTVLMPPFLNFMMLFNLGMLEKVYNHNYSLEVEQKLAIYFSFWLKVIITTAYCSAGISKIWPTISASFFRCIGREGAMEPRFWWDGATMQACIFEAMFLSGHHRDRESTDDSTNGMANGTIGNGDTTDAHANGTATPSQPNTNGTSHTNGTSPTDVRNCNGSTGHQVVDVFEKGENDDVAEHRSTASIISKFLSILTSNKGLLPHWTFLIFTPYSYDFQRFSLFYPTFLILVSFGGVMFEVIAPIVLLPNLVPHWSVTPSTYLDSYAQEINVAFTIIGFLFHYGIAVFQNVDFISWWLPCYAVFLCDPLNGMASVKEELSSVIIGVSYFPSFPASTFAEWLAMFYVTAHLWFIIYLRFSDKEFLPFSGFKMFSEIKDLFDGRYRKWVWLSDKEHTAGTLKNYSFPFCRNGITAEELSTLDFKYLLVGHGGMQKNGGRKDSTNKNHLDNKNSASDMIATQKLAVANGSNHISNGNSNGTSHLSALWEGLLSNNFMPSLFGTASNLVTFDKVGENHYVLSWCPEGNERTEEITIYTNLAVLQTSHASLWSGMTQSNDDQLRDELVKGILEMAKLGRLGKGEFRHAENVEKLLDQFEQLRGTFKKIERF